MSRLLDQPRLVYPILVVAGIACFLLAGVDGGDPADGSERAHDAGYYVAGAAWMLLMLVIVALIAYSVLLVVRRRRNGVAA